MTTYNWGPVPNRGDRFFTIKRTVNWLVAFFGCALSIIGLTSFGSQEFTRRLSLHWLIYAVVVLIFSLAPVATSLLAIRNRKYAGALSLVAGSLAVISVAALGGFTRNDLLIWTTITLVAFIGPGLCWLGTGRLGWPTLLPDQRLRPGAAMGLLAVLACLVVSVMAIGLSLAVTLSSSYGCALDCGGIPPPFARQVRREQAVFVARVRHISHVPIGVVQKYFWGLPWWERKIVIFTHAANDGEVYFIDGTRLTGLLPGVVPTIDFCRCNRTALLKDAELDLRVLKDGPPASGVRIIGRVLRYVDVRARTEGVAGAKVKITGPTGSFVLTTDQSGIYDRGGLPDGDYNMELAGMVTEEGYGECGTYAY